MRSRAEPRTPDGCYPEAELARFAEEGPGDAERSRHDAHLEGCARCRSRLQALSAIAADLAAPPVGAGRVAGTPVPDLAAMVLRRAAMPPPRRRFAVPAVWAAAAMVSLGLGLTAARRHERDAPQLARRARSVDGVDEHGFQARGALPASDDAWVGLHAYRVPGGDSAEPPPESIGPDGAALHPRDGVLVAYDNTGPSPYQWLMVFAVDDRGRVYWHQPGSNDVRAASVPAEAGPRRELRDEVRWPLAPGPLQLHALFSRSPLTVGAVERALRRHPSAARVDLPETAQRTLLVQVQPGPAEAAR